MKRPVFDESWSAEIREVYRNDLREMWDRSIERHSFNSYHYALDLYRGIVEERGARTVLDVGAAQATLAILLAEAGLIVTAVDIRDEFLTYAKTRVEHGDIRFIAGNTFDLEELGEFDVVFANQIIEHLVYPADFLAQLKRFVKADGVLVITTPNHDYFRSTLPSYRELGDPRDHEHRQFSAGGADHFFAYTEEEVREAATTAGLSVQRVVYNETPWVSGHFMFRYLHYVLPIGLLKTFDKLALRLAPRKLAHQLLFVLQPSREGR